MEIVDPQAQNLVLLAAQEVLEGKIRKPAPNKKEDRDVVYE